MVKFADVNYYNELTVLEQIFISDQAKNETKAADMLIYETAITIADKMIDDALAYLSLAIKLGDAGRVDELKWEIRTLQAEKNQAIKMLELEVEEV